MIFVLTFLMSCTQKKIPVVTYQLSWYQSSFRKKTVSHVLTRTYHKIDSLEISEKKLIESIKANRISKIDKYGLDVRMVAILNLKDTIVISDDGEGIYKDYCFLVDTVIGEMLSINCHLYDAEYFKTNSKSSFSVFLSSKEDSLQMLDFSEELDHE